jgi:hypothetical protein
MSIEYQTEATRIKAIESDNSPLGRQERVRSIRQLSESQVETWRQIPMAALMADPEPGRLGENAYAYCDGYLPIWSSNRSDASPAVLVDLATGKLVRGVSYDEKAEQTESNRGTAQPGVPAEDADLLRLDVEELDAPKALLKLRLQQVRASVLENPDYAYHLLKRRQHIIEQFGLKNRYERPVVTLGEQAKT